MGKKQKNNRALQAIFRLKKIVEKHKKIFS